MEQRCPICKKTFESPSDSKVKSYFPFCSERCKLIDLGRWLEGRYQIPVRDKSDEEENGPRG